MHSNGLNSEQPIPISNGSVPIWELVIKDMEERNRIGTEKYGTPLQSFNGRDSLVDVYQESLDKTVYLRQLIEERDKLKSEFRELVHEFRWHNASCQSMTDKERSDNYKVIRRFDEIYPLIFGKE